MVDIVKNVYFSTNQRDATRYPSASSFTLDLPDTIKKVAAVRVRNFKYTPESLVNANNRSVTVIVGSAAHTVTIPQGDYGQSIATFLTTVNGLLATYGIVFTVDANTNLTTLGFTTVSGASRVVQILYCGLLKILGFTTGVCVYTGPAPAKSSLGPNVIFTGSSTVGSLPCAVINNTDLVLRITGLEAISSVDNTCDRATAVLMSTRVPLGTVYNLQEKPLPLLQVQHRLQVLRVQILNTVGDPYDLTTGGGASFLLELHCLTESCEQ